MAIAVAGLLGAIAVTFVNQSRADSTRASAVNALASTAKARIGMSVYPTLLT